MSITAEALISQRKKNKLGSIARKHNGELVHFYDQGKDQRTKKDDLTSGGWCFAMSNYWLSYDDTADFWLWFETEESEQRLRAQMARQAIVKATLIAAKGSDKNPDFRWSEQYKQKIGFNADLENAARQDDRNLLKKILRNAGLNPMEEHYKWGDEASGYWRLAQIITTSPRTKFAIAYWYTTDSSIWIRTSVSSVFRKTTLATSSLILSMIISYPDWILSKLFTVANGENWRQIV